MKVLILNKKKFERIIILIILSCIFLGIIGITKAYSKEILEYKEEYIYSGDTLWSIAEKEANENKYYEKEDIRNIVFDIKKVNKLEDSNLQVGQKILIPVVY